MTKEVFVTIEGMQSDSSDETVTSNTVGEYHLRNGKHFIQYEEATEDGIDTIHNMIKIAPGQIDITKKGQVNSNMIFNIREETRTIYQTPYGVLSFDIRTELIEILDEPELIQVKLRYNLFSEENFVSSSRIRIVIKPK